jgi:DNA replication protein DnaC
MKISVAQIITNNFQEKHMLNHPTLDKLRTLRLIGMAEAFQEQLTQPLPDLDFESRLVLLIEREWYLRENRRLKRRLSQAKLQQTACIEDIDFKHPRGLNKSNILELARGQWIHQHLNLLITGPTGCGKTYLACAITHKACLTGFTSRYYRLPRLWHEHLNDATLADAILDRLVHNAIKLDLKGDSLRKKQQATLQNEDS